MPWTCKCCAKNTTTRRPPNNECYSCRPYSIIGWHNKLVPNRRLVRKTPPAAIRHKTSNNNKACGSKSCVGTFAWEKAKKEARNSAQFVRLQGMKRGVEAEFPILLQITRDDYASAHSILASAHSLLQCFECSKISLPCKSELAIAGLVSFAMATSARVCDPDSLRTQYRTTRKIKRPEMMAVECFWTNELGNCRGADGLLGS